MWGGGRRRFQPERERKTEVCSKIYFVVVLPIHLTHLSSSSTSPPRGPESCFSVCTAERLKQRHGERLLKVNPQFSVQISAVVISGLWVQIPRQPQRHPWPSIAPLFPQILVPFIVFTSIYMFNWIYSVCTFTCKVSCLVLFPLVYNIHWICISV